MNTYLGCHIVVGSKLALGDQTVKALLDVLIVIQSLP